MNVTLHGFMARSTPSKILSLEERVHFERIFLLRRTSLKMKMLKMVQKGYIFYFLSIYHCNTRVIVIHSYYIYVIELQ